MITFVFNVVRSSGSNKNREKDEEKRGSKVKKRKGLNVKENKKAGYGLCLDGPQSLMHF